MNKKILIANIFATLMLLVPMTPVVGVLKETDVNIVESYDIKICQNDGKPDLKIVHVKKESGSNNYPYFCVSIINIGNAVTWIGATRLIVKIASENKSAGSFTGDWHFQKKHAFGEIKTTKIWFGDFSYWETRPSGFYRLFFEVDYNNNVDESNEGNNGVWTYSFIFSSIAIRIWYGFIIRGRLRPWNPNSGFPSGVYCRTFP